MKKFIFFKGIVLFFGLLFFNFQKAPSAPPENIIIDFSLEEFVSSLLQPIPLEFFNAEFPLFAMGWNWLCGLPKLTVTLLLLIFSIYGFVDVLLSTELLSALRSPPLVFTVAALTCARPVAVAVAVLADS